MLEFSVQAVQSSTLTLGRTQHTNVHTMGVVKLITNIVRQEAHSYVLAETLLEGRLRGVLVLPK